MKAKTRLVLNGVCFGLIAGLLVYCLKSGNTFGAVVDVTILVYYTLMMTWAYKDMKRGR